MKNFVKKNKMYIALAIVVAVVAYYYFYKPGNSARDPNATFTVFGTDWCGYTTKQRKHLDGKYGKGSHNYVNCETEECPSDVKGFPVTVHNGTGKRVDGFNTEL